MVFGWLLCGAWGIKMTEKRRGCVEKNAWANYLLGPIVFLGEITLHWPPLLWRFCKGVVRAWKEANKT